MARIADSKINFDKTLVYNLLTVLFVAIFTLFNVLPTNIPQARIGLATFVFVFLLLSLTLFITKNTTIITWIRYLSLLSIICLLLFVVLATRIEFSNLDLLLSLTTDAKTALVTLLYALSYLLGAGLVFGALAAFVIEIIEQFQSTVQKLRFYLKKK